MGCQCTHFGFVLAILQSAGKRVEFVWPEIAADTNRCCFRCEMLGRRVLFDVSDYANLAPAEELRDIDIVFKFHFCEAYSAGLKHVFPLSPVSFYDWRQYWAMQGDIRYQARGRIANKQRAHSQNRERRTHVQKLLRDAYGERLDGNVVEQGAFWRSVGEASVAICVPGARIDILDRGQLQYMAYGACTIAPKLNIDLPWGDALLPNMHYLECAPDWTDLLERVEWADKNPAYCLRVGYNAKQVFQRTLTGAALAEWIQRCLARV